MARFSEAELPTSFLNEIESISPNLMKVFFDVAPPKILTAVSG